MRLELTDRPDQPLGGLLQRHQREAALGQRRQRVALGQTGVDEPEPLVLDAEDLGGPGHLVDPDLVDPAVHLGQVHRRVEDVAPLTAGQRHHLHADALVDVAGHRGGALARLVVRVGVDRHQTQFAHVCLSWSVPGRSSHGRHGSTTSGAPIVPVLVATIRTQTHADRPTEGLNHLVIERPTARYGRQRLTRQLPSPSWRSSSPSVIVAAGVALALVAYQRLGTGEVKGELGGYQLVDARRCEVTISVTREDPSRPVVCIIRARSIDGAEIGRREVLVPPSTATRCRSRPWSRRPGGPSSATSTAAEPTCRATWWHPDDVWSRARRATVRRTPNSQYVKNGCPGGATMDHVHGS